MLKCDSSRKSQKFIYNSLDGTLRNQANLCVSAEAPAPVGMRLYLAPCSPYNPTQMFDFEPNGHARLRNSSGACSYQPCTAPQCCECFDVIGAGTSPGTPISLWPCAMPVATNEVFNWDSATGLLLANTSKLCVDSGEDVSSNITWHVVWVGGQVARTAFLKIFYSLKNNA